MEQLGRAEDPDPKDRKLWEEMMTPRMTAKAKPMLLFKELVEENEILKADLYMQYPDEDKKWRYGAQEHWRGKSVHTDLRLEFEKGKLLLGWTLNTQIKGAVTQPVLSLKEAKRARGYSKIRWGTGEWAKRKRARAEKLVFAEIVSERKKPEPFAWLTFQGAVKPGTVGATVKFPGVLNVVDRGEVEYGAQKPWLHEYFFRSSGKGGLRGRYIFRQLAAREIRGKAFVVAPAEETAFREEGVWLFIKAIDQTPYVLSRRAIEGKWMPPKGSSALPRSIRTGVPVQLRYWETSGKEALERREKLADLLKEKDVLKAAPDVVEFVLQWHGFRKKGEKPVRRGVTTQHYDLRMDFGEPTLRHWVLSGSPLEEKETVGYLKRDQWLPAMKAEGEFEPGHPMNPTKDTRAFVEILDKGPAETFIDDRDLLKVRFKGKRLKGMWVLDKRNSEWYMHRMAEGPSGQKS